MSWPLIWVSWRVQRLQFVLAGAVVGVFGAWLVVTGAHEAAVWSTILSHGCAGGYVGRSRVCDEQWFSAFPTANRWTTTNLDVIEVLPGVLGLVLGALVAARDQETGASRTLWTQSVTRTRWLATKLGVAAAVVVGLVGGLVLVGNWWSGAVRTGPRLAYGTFEVTGFVEVGYALFALLLGAAVGAAVRRVGWAVLIGLPLTYGIRIFTRSTSRMDLLSLKTLTTSQASFTGKVPGVFVNAGDLPLTQTTPLPGQQWWSFGQAMGNCMARRMGSQGPSSQAAYVNASNHCEKALKLHYVVQYQPNSHFWAIQTTDTGLYLLVGILLLAGTLLTAQKSEGIVVGHLTRWFRPRLSTI